ncbi:uncharacterized protein LOC113514409 [Galleria mellonella]|uniref:Uncharacterized protein LOC113514409 n=1 Tax=Galleria mellonella TaxID=7137 RepID=A0A6J1WJG6_GALME|nr:uncharacterized protein LOC113514409 [Galleria mellonella]
MPYYCTVPRCTSMAGKAKNVSFHQFPRDEKLAKLWNEILRRGKPYTKYSKVCSLHFKPEDYTITSVGKNKGQWRTLRKDAIPSQNLPSETPAPCQRTRNSGSWTSNTLTTNILESQMQQQMAQAIYVQTMLAIQAASTTDNYNLNTCNGPQLNTDESTSSKSSTIEQILNTQAVENIPPENKIETKLETSSYKCTECLKCFKDPDVFILHRRIHTKNMDKLVTTSTSEKENLNTNGDVKQEMLKANPILANLLQTGVAQESHPSDTVYDTNNIVSIENHIMTALAANMENYIRSLSSVMNTRLNGGSDEIDSPNSTDFQNSTDQDQECDTDINKAEDPNNLVIEENA